MDIRQQDLLLWVRTFQFLPLLSRQILIGSLVWFGEQRGTRFLSLSIMRISRELGRRWLELFLRGIFLLMIRFWSFRQMKTLTETRTIWSMDVRFITLRIFKFQENEKTRLKSDFGLFSEIDFFWYATSSINKWISEDLALRFSESFNKKVSILMHSLWKELMELSILESLDKGFLSMWNCLFGF